MPRLPVAVVAGATKTGRVAELNNDSEVIVRDGRGGEESTLSLGSIATRGLLYSIV